MVYLLGKKISDNVLLSRGLIKMYGIGEGNSEKICRYFGFLNKIRVKNLTQKDWSNILKYVRKKKLKIEKDLIKKLTFNVSNLINIRNYRGLRHRRGLPVRGQRSHSNSKTQKKLYSSRLSKRNFSTNSIILGFFSTPCNYYSLKKRSSIFKKWKYTKKRWFKSFLFCFNKYYIKNNKKSSSINHLDTTVDLSFFKKPSVPKVQIKNKFEFKKKLAFKNKFAFLKKIIKKVKQASGIRKQFFIKSQIRKLYKNKSFSDRTFHLYQLSEVTLYVNVRYNNLFVFAYDSTGNLLTWASGGSLKLKGKQQGSRYAGKVVTEFIVLKLMELKIKYLKLVVKGVGPSRKAALLNIRKKKFFRLTAVVDATKLPFNGCRVKKVKR
jgi:small subunit ribosomal protein S13